MGRLQRVDNHGRPIRHRAIGLTPSGYAHAALGGCGAVPVIGAVCDVADAALSVKEGDLAGAALAVGAAVPVIGEVAAATRAARQAARLRAAETAGRTAASRVATVVTTGQRHHVISTRIGRALERHPSLAGYYSRRDSRFITEAVDEAAHRGYQRWHRDVDKEVVRWLGQNRNVTPKQFESYLRWRYSRPDLRGRFPNGF
jgi:cytochrome c1